MGMTRPLRVLLVEDQPSDAALVLRELRSAGYPIDHQVVLEEDAFLRCLSPELDVILADYHLPQFSAPRALELLQERALDVPLIVVSGTIGEEPAVEMMRKGATDYVLKDRLKRLGPAIDAAMEKRDARRVQESTMRALREAESRYRLLAENIDAVLWMTDPKTTDMQYVSPAYERIWGRTCESLYAAPMSFAEAVHPDDRAELQRVLEDQKTTGRFDCEYRIVRPDGSIRWIRDRSFPILGPDGALAQVAGIAEDITDRHRLEQTLLQAQKMEAIGLFAGGIAHDFNNMLTAVMGYTEIVLASTPRGDERHENLRQVMAAAQRAATLTRQLLAYGRRTPGHVENFHLWSAVEEADGILRRLLTENIRLEMKRSTEQDRVSADKGQMVQVILNLAVNARDAMPDGGALGIEVRRTEDGLIALDVTDSGTGISPEVCEVMFEPFFTTKEKGKGTGLGLATTQSIVEKWRGRIEVTSEVGSGTRFTVLLPTAEVAEEAEAVTPPPPPARGEETLLIVEDEPMLRRLSTRVLRDAGYAVLAAADGLEALESIERRRPDLVITDVVMPNLGGPGLAGRIRERWPTVAMIYTSGYSNDQAVVDEVEGGLAAFLAKPYTPASLTRVVREVLDLAAAAGQERAQRAGSSVTRPS
jgi:PAS domain S-box-containing protein